jgi:tRNA (Thr-GGU) A37 N-methylase
VCDTVSPLKKIEISPIGFVKRTSSVEDVKDRSLVSKIVFRKDLAEALDGVEEFSHFFVIFWMHQIFDNEKVKVHPSGVGIFATRALVELVRREKSVLWVKGLDASDGTPVLDIKPYPDWERGRLIVVTDFRVPKWLEKINK